MTSEQNAPRVWVSGEEHYLAHTPFPGRNWAAACGVDLTVYLAGTTQRSGKPKCGACLDVIDHLEATHDRRGIPVRTLEERGSRL